MQAIAALVIVSAIYSNPNNANTLYIAAPNPISAHAFRDRDSFPPNERKYMKYFTTECVAADNQVMLADALAYACCSLSHKTDVSFQIPIQIAPTLFRIDTRGLGWEHVYEEVMIERYPYYDEFYSDYYIKNFAPLVINAHWFVANILDSTETGDAQYKLLYGTRNYPKTEAEFFKFWDVSPDPEYRIGLIAGNSPVAGEKTRLLDNRAAGRRGYAYITGDARELVGKFDPLENLPFNAQVDAREYIIGMKKWRKGKSGYVQAYWLADGKGAKQDKAPVDIVHDYTNIRGFEIINSSSCMYCHVAGLIPPSTDEYKLYIEKGNHIDADYLSKYKIERYLESDIAKEIALNNQGFADGVLLINGMKPEQNGAAFKLYVTQYDATMDLTQAARELYCTPKELQLAIGYYSRVTGKLGARGSALGTGGAISRDDFKFRFYLFQEILSIWRKL